MEFGDQFLEQEDEEDDVMLGDAPYAQQQQYIAHQPPQQYYLVQHDPHQQMYPQQGYIPYQGMPTQQYVPVNQGQQMVYIDHHQQLQQHHHPQQHHPQQYQQVDHAYSSQRPVHSSYDTYPINHQPNTSYDEDAIYQIFGDDHREVDLDSNGQIPTLYPEGPVKSENASPPKPKKVSNTIRRMPKEETTLTTDAATAAAVQRIATPAGWKQMNQWLRTTGKDTNKLRTLLTQCYQAKITVSLLSSNDTPKFVRKLSKSHEDPEIRKLATDIVAKWKKAVANPEAEPPKKDTKEEKEEHIEERKEEEEMVRSPSPKKVEASEEKKDKREKPARTKARVYQAKFRSTGLEGDEPVPSTSKDKKKKDGEASPPAKKASMDGPEKAGVVPVVKKAAPITPKKPMLSTGFMDALMPSVDAPPKKKAPPKKRTSTDKAPSGTTTTPVAKSIVDTLLSPSPASGSTIVLEGLYSDQSRTIAEPRKRTPSPPAPILAPPIAIEEPNISVGKRRIRFADEHGGELVDVRFFEVEEGERINVNRFTPEQMKHHEMMMERKFRVSTHANQHFMDEESSEKEMEGVKWNLVIVDDVPNLVVPGASSQMKLIQLERQQHALKSFYCADVPQDITEEPDDDVFMEPPTQPKIIPLELVDEAMENEQMEIQSVEEPPPVIPTVVQEEPPAVIPEKLKNLLDGLKRSGIFKGDDNSPAEPEPTIQQILTVSPDIAQLVKGAHESRLTSSGASAWPTGPAVVQQPAPAAGYYPPGTDPYGAGAAPPRAHHIQQHFPPAPNDPNAIQFVPNMDVHAAHLPTDGPPRGGFGGGPRPLKICTFYNSPAGCTYGNRCRFSHGNEPTLGWNAPPPGPPRGRPFGPPRGRGAPPMRPPFGGRGRFNGSFRDKYEPRRDRRDWERDRERDRDRDRDRDERRERRRSRSRSRSRSPSPRRSRRHRRDEHREDSHGDTDIRQKDTDHREEERTTQADIPDTPASPPAE